jgi:SPOR domain
VLVRVVRLAVWPNELRFSRASRGRRQRVTQIRWFISETFESELVRCVVTICSVSDGRDPVAELARTTGRADPRNENAPTNNRLGESPPLAPADYPSAPERACERHRHDDALSERPYGQRDRAYDVNYGTEEYTIEMSREPQLIRLVLVIAIFVAGTGIAFGYRAMFGSSTSPTLPPITHPTKGSKEIVRVSRDAQPNHNGSTSQVGAATAVSIENLVSHEQLDPGSLTGMGTPAAAIPSTAGQALPNRATPVGAEEGADSPWPPAPTATPAAAPISAPQRSPERVVESSGSHVAALTPASLNSVLAVAPKVSGGRYTVQVTAERSESKARVEFRALQARYRNQLSGRHPIIRRANLGTRGTYYRVLVGPFASAQEARLWCSGLRAAGDHCVVQPN